MITIIKFVRFKPVYYDINLGVVSSSMVFSDLISFLISMYYSFESIKLFYFQKKKTPHNDKNLTTIINDEITYLGIRDKIFTITLKNVSNNYASIHRLKR